MKQYWPWVCLCVLAVGMPAEAQRSSRDRDRGGERGGSTDARPSADLGPDPIATKSIFSRDRRPPSAYAPTTREYTPAPPLPPRLPVLVGIVREDDGIVAVFEHPGVGRISHTRLGGELPDGLGTLHAMTLDFIEILPADANEPVRIAIGQDLRGSTQYAGSRPSTTAPAGDGPAVDAASIEGDDPISRLRRRRLEELGR